MCSLSLDQVSPSAAPPSEGNSSRVCPEFTCADGSCVPFNTVQTLICVKSVLMCLDIKNTTLEYHVNSMVYEYGTHSSVIVREQIGMFLFDGQFMIVQDEVQCGLSVVVVV